MLDSLSTRLQTIFDKLGGRGRLSEENIQEALREVRLALLEADVNFKVVRAFIDRVKDKAVGQDVLTSLTPAQQVVKVVHGELVELLGGSGHRLATAPHPPTVIMLMGLQGSGKTTTAAKLARLYSKQGQHPLLAAADTQRPAPSPSWASARRRTRSSRSIPTAWPRASSEWATCSRWSRRRRRRSIRPRPRRWPRSFARTPSHSKTSAISSSSSARWARSIRSSVCSPSARCSRAPPRSSRVNRPTSIASTRSSAR